MVRTCHLCDAEAIGRCRDCRKLYCGQHGRVLCENCRRSHRVPMALLAALGTFPASVCTLVGVVYQALRIDIFGPVGIGILIAAAVITAGAVTVVWRHPEGIAHAQRPD